MRWAGAVSQVFLTALGVLLGMPGLAAPAEPISITAVGDPPQAASDTRPHAVISAFPMTMYCPQQVSFDGNGSYHGDPARHIVSYEWDYHYHGSFSAESPGSTTSLAYGEVGAFTAALRVTDDAQPAQSDIATTTVRVLNRPPVADAGGPYTVAIGRPLFLSAAASSDPDQACADAIVGYSWDLDGNGIFFDTVRAKSPGLVWEQVESLVCRGPCVAGTIHEIAVAVGDRHGRSATARTTVRIIAAPAKLSVTWPNGGEFLGTGRPQAIRWEAGPEVARVRVLLSADGTNWQVIVPDAKAAAGTATWTPPPAAHTITRRNWLIKVQGFREGALVAADVSDAPFGIGPLDVRRAEKGAEVGGGEAYQLTWVTYETAEKVASTRFKYSLDKGHTWKTITMAGNPKVFRWLVPYRLERTEGCRARLEMYGASGRLVGSDAGEGSFTILGGVNLVAPERGDALYGGTSRAVVWHAHSAVRPSSTRLRLTTDGGTTWFPLATFAGNPGYFHWSVPVPEAPASACRIEVALLDANGAAIATDRGDGFFTILVGDATPPGPVTQFTATPAGSSMNLAWINPADGDFTGVRVVRRADRAPLGPIDGTLVCDTPGASITDTALARGTYYYAAFAHDATLNYAPAATAAAQVLLPALPPASIAVPPASNMPAYPVTWGASNSAGVTYEVEEATDPDFVSNLRAAYAGYQLWTQITGRANGVTYHYRVRAVGPGLDPSAWVSGGNGCAVSWDATPPGPVTEFAATVAGNRVDLTWINPADADFAGVRVMRRMDVDPIDVTDGTPVYDGRGQTFSNVGLALGAYHYAIFAYDAERNYAPAVRTTAQVEMLTVGAPSYLAYFETSAFPSYQVSWPASATPEATYELQEAMDPEFVTGLRTAYSGPLLTVQITDRANGTTYYYRVRALRDGWYQSEWRVGFHGCAVSWDEGPPGPVTNFTANVVGNHVELTWVNPSDVDLAGVMVLRRTDAFPVDVSDGTLVYEGLGESFVDPGLAPRTYYYGAFAFDNTPNFSSAALAIARIDPQPSCEGCHNGDGDGDGVWTGVGYDPDGPGPLPAAPNVMGDGVDPVGSGATPKPYDDGRWGFNVNGHGSNGSAPYTPVNYQGFPWLTQDAECTDCHDITIPAGTHLDGVLNSVELKLNPNENTAHLNSSYIGASSPDWSVQVAFDNRCTTQCHSGNHRHTADADPAPGVVRFGDRGVGPLDGELISLPIDSALSTNASTDEPDYLPCISCHNPHGTGVVEWDKSTNRMLRDNWVIPDPLCVNYCHRDYP